jgi:hypothetical protein
MISSRLLHVADGYDEERTCERRPECSEDKELFAVRLAEEMDAHIYVYE